METKLKDKFNLPGTKLSANNTQLLISSGIPSLDDIIGGFPVGTITLIEEDAIGNYSKLMLQYFLAEGAVCKHSLFVASQEIDPKQIVSNLPAVITSEDHDDISKGKVEDKLTIAWRYQNVPSIQSKTLSNFGHYYDLTKKMDSMIIQKADITCWNVDHFNLNESAALSTEPYCDLLKSIKKKIDDENFFVKPGTKCDTILRIAIHSLGSPMWLNDRNSDFKHINTFFYCLRALLRSSFAVAVITIPTNVINKNLLSRCIHLSDVVVSLQSFTGTELEKNPVLSDYQGFFNIVKVSAINTLTAKEPGTLDFAFKLRRKKFVIKKLHLPPELQDSREREQDDITSVGCGSSKKHLLEF